MILLTLFKHFILLFFVIKVRILIPKAKLSGRSNFKVKKVALNICKFVHFPYSFVGFPIAGPIGTPAASHFTSSCAIRIVTGGAPHILALVTDS